MNSRLPLGPMLASLSRHRLTAALLVLEVACTCAIVTNVTFMIAARYQQMLLPSGIAESEIVMLDSIDTEEGADRISAHRQDLAALQAIAGVLAVVAVDSLPLSRNSWSNGVATQAHIDSVVSASAYDGTPGELKTLGLRLLEGRDFRNDEYLPTESAHGWTGISKVPVTIVTRALAARLFPGEDALGKSVYLTADHPTLIVGIIDRLLQPSLDESADTEYSMLFPMLPDQARVTYVLRCPTPDRDRVLKAAGEVLTSANPSRVLKYRRSFTQLRAHYFQRDLTMIGLLLAACLGLAFVTGLGIAGLANFWVQQRSRQIGIRRALGARRGDILRYFQIENFMIVGAGIVLGMGFAYALNLGLMKWYELPRLPLVYLPAGAVAFWLLGQLAVLAPALRASQLPPVIAIRSI